MSYKLPGAKAKKPSNKVPKSMVHAKGPLLNLFKEDALARIVSVRAVDDKGKMKYYVTYLSKAGSPAEKENTSKRHEQVVAFLEQMRPVASSSQAPKPPSPKKASPKKVKVVKPKKVKAAKPKKAKAPRDKSKLSRGKDNEVKCAKKGKVVNLSYSKNTKTKRNVYKAMCTNGATRLITRAQYARYLSRGVEGRALPVKKVAVKRVRATKRGDVDKYCGYYGNYYQSKCMKTLGDEKACGKIKSGRTKYCKKVGARTHVSSRGSKATKTPRPKSSKGMFALLGF